VPVRARQAERAFVAGSPLEDVAATAMGEIDPLDDLHATGAYRRQAAGVLVRRAIEKALQEAVHA
jgi:carbon-monoxide dehydrogenase medium subunit